MEISDSMSDFLLKIKVFFFIRFLCCFSNPYYECLVPNKLLFTPLPNKKNLGEWMKNKKFRAKTKAAANLDHPVHNHNKFWMNSTFDEFYIFKNSFLINSTFLKTR